MASPYKLYDGATRPDAITGLNPAFNQALEALFAAAPPEVKAELGLQSGYRSRAVQQKLWDKSDKTGRTVAAPGRSKHQHGTAADLFGFGLGGKGYVSKATRDWVHQNAAQFGLYFPMDYEPWHIQLKAEMAQGGDGSGTAQQMVSAGYTPEQIKKAFLDTIASTEANSYDVMYGGEKFSDFSRHPERDIPIFKGSQITGHSSAAGRYQFLKDTWREQAAKYGYKDFSPETQDTAAWNYASDIFKQKGGGDLMEALSSNDPARQNAAAQILNQTWTSLPGGPEQAKGYGNQTFADVFSKQLGTAPATGATTTPSSPYALPPTAKPAQDKYQKAASGALKGLAEMKAPVLGAGGNAPQLPVTAPMPTDTMPIVAGGAAAGGSRDALAQLMANLNNQRLWG